MVAPSYSCSAWASNDYQPERVVHHISALSERLPPVPGHDERAPAENHAQITSDIVSERQGIQSTKIQNEKMSEHKKNQD